MSYHHNAIEAKWQKYWKTHRTFQAKNPDAASFDNKPPFYVLDMFPYPSGAGLHVGHPLGYIASDITARYKRHKGFNVLHPMGYDSFGLPAEQYAIQTGQHPAITTETNINRYREQLDKIGFSFDWSREVQTSGPHYYKWTQWIFSRLFESWYDKTQQKARPITELIQIFVKKGNEQVKAACDKRTPSFTAKEWNQFTPKEQEEMLLKYRLTYLAETQVNWCPGLGTVLANDEVVNGVSERGGFPVERKKMKQWSMRITAYADRLLQDLEKLDWPESLKETQRHWIGKSQGAQITFRVLSKEEAKIKSFDKKTPHISITEMNPENEHLFKQAKENRNNPTDAEQELWPYLKDENLGCKFYHQHVIDDFIVNFVSYRKKLIIEIDGKIYKASKTYEKKRNALLNEKGFEVVHFEHDKIIKDPKAVIGKIQQVLENYEAKEIDVFTTRPDTLFGVSYLTLAPEHRLAQKIAPPKHRKAVKNYIKKSAKRSERERQAETNTISGVFTGAYAEHPFTKELLPIWIGDYVLGGYGTGAVMAVPAGDERDYKFASHFSEKTGMPPIKSIFKFPANHKEEPFYEGKTGYVYQNSSFLDGLNFEEGFKRINQELEKTAEGESTTNYRLRDAVFSRQRYWGEPFPIYYKNGLPQLIPEDCLPIQLPEVEKYLPTEEGDPPLGRAKKWHWDEKHQRITSVPKDEKPEKGIYPLELNTMPGWAGSSWYFFRYMEKNKRDAVFASREALHYWQQVNLYIGGSEHATGHLLYARFWTKFLKDRKLAPVEEPFQKLLNQGMILGESAFAHRVDFNFDLKINASDEDFDNLKRQKKTKDFIFKALNHPHIFLSKTSAKEFKKEGIAGIRQLSKLMAHRKKSIKAALREKNIKVEFDIHAHCTPIHVDISMVNTANELDTEKFAQWREDFEKAEFITEKDGKYTVTREVEKMSKSKFNVVNPDDICAEYGADALRLYEMFLGPIDQDKPWNTAGLSGVYGFLKKLWNLYFSSDSREEKFCVTDEEASREARKILHKTIKKVTVDTENFSFNTAVSGLMICVNQLNSLKCNVREVLEPLTVLVAPYAPHIAEELWEKLGHHNSIATVPYPAFKEEYVVETTKNYPISFNGKTRFTMELPLELTKDHIKKIVMADERTKKRLDGRKPKKVIVVPGKIVNIVG